MTQQHIVLQSTYVTTQPTKETRHAHMEKETHRTENAYTERLTPKKGTQTHRGDAFAPAGRPHAETDVVSFGVLQESGGGRAAGDGRPARKLGGFAPGVVGRGGRPSHREAGLSGSREGGRDHLVGLLGDGGALSGAGGDLAIEVREGKGNLLGGRARSALSVTAWRW